MANRLLKLRQNIGKFLKKVGNKIYYEPDFGKLPPINAIYVPDGMDRITIRKVFTHRGTELIIPKEEMDEEEARSMATELSYKLIPYIRSSENAFDGISKKELTIYVNKNGEY